MSERAPFSIGKEIEQVTRFFQARKETKFPSYTYPPHHFQRTTITGLMTIIPERVHASGILKKPARRAVVDGIFYLQMALNDEMDYKGADNPALASQIDAISCRRINAERGLVYSLAELPQSEAQRSKDLIFQGRDEVIFMEKWIREKKNSGKMVFEDIDYYRNMVNAVNLGMITTTILHDEGLYNRFSPYQSDEISHKTLLGKYGWMFDSVYENDTQRALLIMQNTAMAGQVIDDWKGREIDSSLTVPSYASGALMLANGDEENAKERLRVLREGYKKRAYDLGLGNVALTGSLTFLAGLQNIMGVALDQAKKGENNGLLHQKMIRKEVLRRLYPSYTREADWILGKF